MKQSWKVALICLTLPAQIAIANQHSTYGFFTPAKQSAARIATSQRMTSIGVDLGNLLYNKYNFVLRDSKTGEITYTNSGKFIIANDYIIQSGKRLQGYTPSMDLLSDNCQLSDLKLSSLLPPQATSKISIQLNLDDRSIINEEEFDANNRSTYAFVITSVLYDSKGKSHDSQLFFAKSAPSHWLVYYIVNNMLLAKGHLQFNPDGYLIKAEGLSDIVFSTTDGEQTPQSFTISMTGTTQYASTTTSYQNSQNGHPTLYLTDIDVDEIGYVNQTYTDGRTITAGKIAVLKR